MKKTTTDNLIVANAILKIRKKNQLSQEEFAEKLGMTRQAVSRWEMGISIPNIHTLITISELFNESLDEMLKDNLSEKSNNTQIYGTENVNIKYGIIFLIVGILGILSSLVLCTWQRGWEFEKYNHCNLYPIEYLFSFPLAIVFFVSLILVLVSVIIFYKERRVINEKKIN